MAGEAPSNSPYRIGDRHANVDYWVATISMSQWRLARDVGIPLIDITVKSGIQEFAPTWENLKLYKSGRMHHTDYSKAYYDKVIPTLQTHPQLWFDLAKNKNMAFACYCKAGDYCHRHLFAALAVTFLQSIGRTVSFIGEMQPHPNNEVYYSNEYLTYIE